MDLWFSLVVSSSHFVIGRGVIQGEKDAQEIVSTWKSKFNLDSKSMWNTSMDTKVFLRIQILYLSILFSEIILVQKKHTYRYVGKYPIKKYNLILKIVNFGEYYQCKHILCKK
jgi:hypothetical protein